MPALNPATPSQAYTSMLADWLMVRAIRGGAKAVREGGELYLPKFTAEDDAEYQRRLKHAPFSAHYEDATRTIAAKPFSQETKLRDGAPGEINIWSEDIDRNGNNLHNFTKRVFEDTLHMGLGFILVDHPVTPEVKTLADQARLGARPFFRFIPADDAVSVQESETPTGMRITHLRFKDNLLETGEDFVERTTERIRYLVEEDGAVYQTVYTKVEKDWVASPRTPLVGVDVIPVVPMIFGLETLSKYAVKPPMLDLAYKQIEHYQHANRLSEIFNFAGFPMLQAEGMAPPEGDAPVSVGPRTMLFAGATGAKYSFVEPSATSIKEVREHLSAIEDEMRMLGLQPSLPRTGIQNMAATTSSINASRAHTVLQAWALHTKDVLEQAYVFMAQWAGLSAENIEVEVFTDFSAEILTDGDETVLVNMEASGKISTRTLWDEMKRRDILSPQFDADEEEGRLEDQTDGVNLFGADDQDDAAAAA